MTTLARRVMAELREYSDIPVAEHDIEQAYAEFLAGLDVRSSVRKRTRLVGVAVAAATIAAVVVMVALLDWASDNQPTQPVNTPTPPTVTEGDAGPYLLDLTTGERRAAPAALPAELENAPLYSADGQQLAFSRFDCSNDGDVCSGQRMFVESSDGSRKRVVETPADTDAVPLAWSPAGDQVLYQLRRQAIGAERRYPFVGDLYIYDVATERSTRLTHVDLATAWWYELSADFSPDGRTVAFHLPRSPNRVTSWDVWTVPVHGGDPTLLLRNAAFPRYLPGGSSIAYLRPGTDTFVSHSIGVATVEGTRRTLATTPGTWFLAISPDRTKLLYPTDDGMRLVFAATGDTLDLGAAGAVWVDDHTVLVLPQP